MGRRVHWLTYGGARALHYDILNAYTLYPAREGVLTMIVFDSTIHTPLTRLFSLMYPSCTS